MIRRLCYGKGELKISNKEIIRKIFQSRAENVEGHDPWRYGEELAEITDKVEVGWIIENLNLDEDTTMIDVGCGTGRHVMEIAKNTNAGMVIGCDFIQDNIDFANAERKERGLFNADFFCSGATDFYKRAKKLDYDLITAIGLIQYLTSESELKEFAKCCSDLLDSEGKLLLKHPLSFGESFLLDYHREEMDTRYISSYFNFTDIMESFGPDFELLSMNRTFTSENVGELLPSIERDERAMQMWILFSKKRKTV